MAYLRFHKPDITPHWFALPVMVDKTPVFRFAPSPNGELHLGHALSALLNLQMARASGGKMLLRIDDIDQTRCTPALEKQMLEDLEWLGFEWDEPPMRQSDRFEAYHEAIISLEAKDLIYPATLSRGKIKRFVSEYETNGKCWPRDPDGAPHYPGSERELSATQRNAIRAGATPYGLRLDLEKALQLTGEGLGWQEFVPGGEKLSGALVPALPRRWGDVILARKDTPASYHLCCVVDDTFQGVTHVVRGQDLYEATAIHRVLQELLGFLPPLYHHHVLITDDMGRKLSKSERDTGIRQLRLAGEPPTSIRNLVEEIQLKDRRHA